MTAQVLNLLSDWSFHCPTDREKDGLATFYTNTNETAELWRCRDYQRISALKPSASYIIKQPLKQLSTPFR